MQLVKERQSWDGYFMGLAYQVAQRSTCLRRQVGAVAVNERRRIIGTGYNGAPSGLTHCTPDSCIRIRKNIPSGERLDLCKAIHAEANKLFPFFRPMTRKTSRNIRTPSLSTRPNMQETAARCHNSSLIRSSRPSL